MISCTGAIYRARTSPSARLAIYKAAGVCWAGRDKSRPYEDSCAPTLNPSLIPACAPMSSPYL
ncbi:MAG: hypothetical protein FWG81_08060 [Betaproteobacteria bacterium]|nr:hypothetical protein [Betaproteobacteria bacterium]